MNFSQMILTMQQFWSTQGCAILQAMDTEVGAATYHIGTIFGILNAPNYNVQFVQPSKRPQDGRSGTHPNRLFTHHQFQVIMQPIPNNIQQLVLECFAQLGLHTPDYDIRFIEDDWKNPTIGAAGLGWEVRCNELEVLQYTYFQQIGGITLKHIPVELAFGLERLALRVQKITSIYDLMWSDTQTYGDIRLKLEQENTNEILYTPVQNLLTQFKIYLDNSNQFLQNNLPLAAYIQCTKMSHTFNILDTIGLSNTEREQYIEQIRNQTKKCILLYTQSLSDE